MKIFSCLPPHSTHNHHRRRLHFQSIFHLLNSSNEKKKEMMALDDIHMQEAPREHLDNRIK